MAITYTVDSIRQLIEKSQTMRKQDFLDNANRNLKWYRNNYATINGSEASNDFYWENIVYMILRTMVTSVYNKNPDYSYQMAGDLSREVLEMHGIKLRHGIMNKVLEAVSKIYYKEMDLHRTNKLLILDAGWAGFGVSKMGFDYDLKHAKEYDLDYILSLPKEKAVKLADSIEISSLVRSNEPFALRVDPRLMLFPTDAPSISRRQWECQEVYKNKEDAEKEYNVTGLPTYSTNTYQVGQKKYKDNQVKLYEFHSLDPNDPRIVVLADGYNKFLENKEHPLVDKTGRVHSMFQYLWFNEPLDSLYPDADISLVSPQVREYNIQIEKRVDHVRKFVSMYYVEGQAEPDQIENMKKGVDGTVLEFREKGNVGEIPKLNLSVDFYQGLASLRNEMFEVLGLTDYQVGGNTQNRKATEAQIVTASASQRVLERVEAVDELINQQMDTFVEIIKQYQQVERIFALEIDNESITIPFSGQLLAMSDIKTRVVPGSTIASNKIEEMQNARVTAEVANVFADVANRVEAYKDVLRAAGKTDLDKYINPAVNPQGSLPGADGVTPALGGQQGQAGVPTQTPAQQGRQPI